MIMGPANHGLYVIFLATVISSSLYCLIFAMTSSPLYQLGHKSALAFSVAKVLYVIAVYFDCWLTKTSCRPMLFWTRLGLTHGMLTSVFTRPS